MRQKQKENHRFSFLDMPSAVLGGEDCAVDLHFACSAKEEIQLLMALVGVQKTCLTTRLGTHKYAHNSPPSQPRPQVAHSHFSVIWRQFFR